MSSTNDRRLCIWGGNCSQFIQFEPGSKKIFGLGWRDAADGWLTTEKNILGSLRGLPLITSGLGGGPGGGGPSPPSKSISRMYLNIVGVHFGGIRKPN